MSLSRQPRRWHRQALNYLVSINQRDRLLHTVTGRCRFVFQKNRRTPAYKDLRVQREEIILAKPSNNECMMLRRLKLADVTLQTTTKVKSSNFILSRKYETKGQTVTHRYWEVSFRFSKEQEDPSLQGLKSTTSPATI